MQLRTLKANIVFRQYEQFDKEINELISFINTNPNPGGACSSTDIKPKLNSLLKHLGSYCERVHLTATKNLIQQIATSGRTKINEMPTIMYQRDCTSMIDFLRQTQFKFGNAIADEIDSLETKGTSHTKIENHKADILYTFYQQLDGELKEIINFLNQHFLNQTSKLHEGVIPIQNRIKLLLDHLEKIKCELFNKIINLPTSQQKMKEFSESLTYFRDETPTLCNPKSFPILITALREVQMRWGILITEELELLKLPIQNVASQNSSPPATYPGFLSK